MKAQETTIDVRNGQTDGETRRAMWKQKNMKIIIIIK